MDINKETIDIIKETAKEYFSDAEIMLFGSRVRGTSDKVDSDFDILVIINQELSPKQKLPIRTKIRKKLLQKRIRSDILIQSKTELNRKKKLPGHIVKNIVSEGVIL